MTTYATLTTKTAWLGHEFGESYARRLFGDAVVDALPKGKRGKYVGKIKADLEWTKVERGGWVRHEGFGGHVENRVGKVIAARLITRAYMSGEVTVHATKEGDTVTVSDAILAATDAVGGMTEEERGDAQAAYDAEWGTDNGFAPWDDVGRGGDY